jgi:hypothetical protein
MNTTQLQRYIAIVLYESSSSAPGYKPLYEECWMVVEATSEQHAHQKVHELALQSETAYQNKDGETIHQSLKQVVDVSPLLDDTLHDGAMLYARHFRNYQAYVEMEPLLSGEEL